MIRYMRGTITAASIGRYCVQPGQPHKFAWLLRRPPEPCAHVRIVSGAPLRPARNRPGQRFLLPGESDHMQPCAAGCPSLSWFPEYTRNGLGAIRPAQRPDLGYPRNGPARSPLPASREPVPSGRTSVRRRRPGSARRSGTGLRRCDRPIRRPGCLGFRR